MALHYTPCSFKANNRRSFLYEPNFRKDLTVQYNTSRQWIKMISITKKWTICGDVFLIARKMRAKDYELLVHGLSPR